MSHISSESRSESPLNAHKNEWQVWGPSSRSGSPQTENPASTPLRDFQGIPGPGPTSFINGAPMQVIENDWIEVTTVIAPPPSNELPPPGWFPRPVAPEHHVYPDARVMPPMSPTGGVPYLVPYPHPSFPIRFGDDNQQPFHGIPIEDDRLFHLGRPPPRNFQSGPFLPPFPQLPINLNPHPEFGSYYLASPFEPFVEHSFAFSDGFNRPMQTNVLYPAPPQPHHIPPNFHPMPPHPHPMPPHLHPMPPHPYPPINLDSYSHRRLPSGPQPNTSGPEIMQQMVLLPYDFSMQGPPLATPPEYFYPSPPHIIVSPPEPSTQSNLPTGSGSSEPFDNAYNIQQPQDAEHSNNQTIPRSLLRCAPSTAIVASPKAKRPSLPNLNTLSVQRNHRRNRRQCLPKEHSPLMGNFKANREKAWDFKEILGHVVEFSGDQHGSRFIQLKLEVITDEEKQVAFDEIHPDHTEELIQHVFGNYVIQKFFDCGTTAQKDAITGVVERWALDFSLHIYGCRVVQKAIDCIPEPRAIIQHLEHDILTCIKDPHGNHVVQKLVQVVTPGLLTFLPLICDNLLDLATHSYGCRVLQRCLEYVPEEYLDGLLEAIHRYTLELMQNQYGNYVTQFIIEHGRPKDRDIVVSKILDNLVNLSQHKYASNVCEKALIHSDSDTRYRLIHEITAAPTDSENSIVKMIKDQYANYVLQRSLLVAEGEQKEALYAQVKPLIIALRHSRSQHTHRPLLSIERLVNEFYGTQQSEAEDISNATRTNRPPLAAPNQPFL